MPYSPVTTKIKSDNIRSILYDPSSLKLKVMYGNGTYEYPGVMKGTVERIQNETKSLTSVIRQYVINVVPKDKVRRL